MITDNFKNKMLNSIKDNIYCFSYTVNNMLVEKAPYSIDVENKSIKVTLILDSSDVGKISNIKLLDADKQVLFETNTVYYKDNETGVYISFSISDIVEVN